MTVDISSYVSGSMKVIDQSLFVTSRLNIIFMVYKLFSINEYDVTDGFLIFIDRVTSKTKMFAVANCEIEVLE